MNLEYIQQEIKENIALALYISSENCGVCHVLQPKLFAFLAKNFPELKIKTIQTALHPEIPAYYQVFTVPTLLIFFDGKEYLRKSRVFGLNEVAKAIARPYEMIFDTKENIS